AGLQLQGDERLFDLYCGVGTFALPLARSAARVTGIEDSPGAVRAAERTAEANKLTNTRFRAGPVERAISDYQHGAEAIVLDPPRRGCHPRAIEEMLRLNPRRIAYVSCHPGTLARDLKALVAGGYTVTRVTPVDIFPQTPHIESVSVLEKQGPPSA
ncbi:MAG: class I SAM-dependent RNA methyltransferase, partial [Roseiflexaceae bacterium]|nr:class I SAM-dependent RNA methyltransferase [Roseiflexaceae bacterium]